MDTIVEKYVKFLFVKNPNDILMMLYVYVHITILYYLVIRTEIFEKISYILYQNTIQNNSKPLFFLYHLEFYILILYIDIHLIYNFDTVHWTFKSRILTFKKFRCSTRCFVSPLLFFTRLARIFL